jgi:hypothetical protein
MCKAGMLAVVALIVGMNCLPQTRKADVTSSIDLSQCQDYPEKDFLPIATVNAASIQRFYEVHFQSKRLKTGQVDVLFILDGRGLVSQCQVESTTLNDAEFEDALLKRLKHWKLPPQTDGDDAEALYKFRYAFIFRR